MHLTVSDEFVPGRHRIAAVGPSFTAAFGGMKFRFSTSPPSLLEFNLARPMTDADILAAFALKACTIEQIFAALHRPHWPWSLSYVYDCSRNLRPVSYELCNGEWRIDTRDFGGEWPALFRVYGGTRGAIGRWLARLTA